VFISPPSTVKLSRRVAPYRSPVHVYPLRPGMSLVVNGTKTFDCHVGIKLSRGKGRVPEQLLNAAKVRTSLQQMRRGGVPQAVRTKIRCARHSRDRHR
jgi:hypothetical protein